MSFRLMSAEEKIAVLCEVIKKGKIEPVVRGCRVKQAFCLRVSQEALRKGLEPHKRGPRFKRNPEDRRVEELLNREICVKPLH